ncbi:glycosyltransferase [Halalkalibaculum roseum]|nr:glycosyltransferase family 2 protein [Halalkalibaculum roseum]
MIYLLYIAVIYLAITSMIFFLNRRDFGPLLPAQSKSFDKESPKVSILIPARNEENVIQKCLESALIQSYPNFEVIVLDDESTDNTPLILKELVDSKPHTLKVIKGRPKPKNWLGKPWACQQLSEEAEGNILIFIDADTWLEEDMVSKIVRSMGRDVVDFLTVWPKQKLGTFWEKTVIPLVYYALLSLLPARYVHKVPAWVPDILKPNVRPLFAAACGQCMAFKRSAYKSIGGHAAVKDEVVEDVALAKRIKEKGLKMKMYHGEASISCRMYTSGKELESGFSKNFLAGFDYNIALFLFMALLHIVVFVLPFVALPIGIITNNIILVLLSGICIAVILLHRFLLARWFDWKPIYAFLHPLAVLWFQRLGIKLVINHFSGKKSSWKGRTIN